MHRNLLLASLNKRGSKYLATIRAQEDRHDRNKKTAQNTLILYIENVRIILLGASPKEPPLFIVALRGSRRDGNKPEIVSKRIVPALVRTFPNGVKLSKQVFIVACGTSIVTAFKAAIARAIDLGIIAPAIANENLKLLQVAGIRRCSRNCIIVQ